MLATDAMNDLKDDPAIVLTKAVEDNGPDPPVDDGFTGLDKADSTEGS